MRKLICNRAFMTPAFTFMSSQKFTYSCSSWTTKTKQTNKEKESDEFYTNLEHEYWRNIWPWTAGETRLKLKLYAWWVSVSKKFTQLFPGIRRKMVWGQVFWSKSTGPEWSNGPKLSRPQSRAAKARNRRGGGGGWAIRISSVGSLCFNVNFCPTS